MRIIVAPAVMEIGGSQMNAIDMADQVQRAGHEVVLYAPDGDLTHVAAERGLEIVRSPGSGHRVTADSVVRLTRLAHRRRIDLVHCYEWRPSVECALGPWSLLGTRMLTTVMSMDVPHLIPTDSDLILGTAELVAEQRGLRPAHLIQPWINTEENRPGVCESASERKALGIGAEDFVVAIVCRLTHDLEKVDGVLAAMRAVQRHELGLRPGQTPRLVVVGDGPALDAVSEAAAAQNVAADYEQVIVTGPMLDPRGIYDCADVIVGMGSSALKGLAFAKPLVVQGTGGYWKRFGPDTVTIFEQQGFFGHANLASTDAAAAQLSEEIRLITSLSPGDLADLSAFGRDFLQAGFSLSAATAAHLAIYQGVLGQQPSAMRRARTTVRTSRELIKLELSRRLSRETPSPGVHAPEVDKRFAAQPSSTPLLTQGSR